MFVLRLSIFFAALFFALGLPRPARAAEPSATTASAALSVGAAWPGLTLNDQHDKPATLASPPLKTLVFAAERKPGDWAQEIIDKHLQAVLKSGQLALVLDISRMPSLVTSMFAMPSFRARAFPILLAREAKEAGAVAALPRRTAQVEVRRRERGRGRRRVGLLQGENRLVRGERLVGPALHAVQHGPVPGGP